MKTRATVRDVASLVLGWTMLGCPAESDDFDPADTAQPADDGADGGTDGRLDSAAETTTDVTSPPDAEADTADAESSLPCGDGVCNPDEHCTSCPADCCVCPATETLVDDSLASAAECTGAVGSGEFAGGGWRVTDFDSRIVYDFGRPVDCGALWVDLVRFNPMTQYVHVGGDDRYVNIIGLYQRDHGNHWDAADSHEAQVALQASDEEPDTFRDRSIKLKTNTGTDDGWGGGDAVYTSEYDWDIGHAYHLCLDWSGERVRLFLDGVEQTATPLTWGSEGASSPAFRYLFLARTNMDWGGWLNGATFANVRIVAGGTCN
jgi:hypothetical protein